MEKPLYLENQQSTKIPTCRGLGINRILRVEAANNPQRHGMASRIIIRSFNQEVCTLSLTVH